MRIDPSFLKCAALMMSVLSVKAIRRSEFSYWMQFMKIDGSFRS